MPGQGWILLAENLQEEAEELVCLLCKAGVRHKIIIANTGSQALSCLRQEGQFAHRPTGDPVFVLLKLCLPVYDGISVLRTIKEDLNLMHVPVIIYSRSLSQQQLQAAYIWGVNGCLIKPRGRDKLAQVFTSVGQFWGTTNVHPGRAQPARS